MSNNIIQLHPAAKDRQATREEASLWVVRLSASASNDDLQKVHEWLNGRPDRVQALLDAARMLDEVSVLSELSDIFPLQEYVKPHPVRAKRGMVYSTLAACLLLLCLFVPILGWLPGGGGKPSVDTSQLSYETRIGEQSTVVLPDGSVVALNTNTRIDISFSDS